MTDPTNPQREIDRRPIRRLEIRPLGEGACADQERFETILTDPTWRPANEPAAPGPDPLAPEESQAPGAAKVHPRAPRDRFTSVLAVSLVLGVFLLGFVLLRSASVPSGAGNPTGPASGPAPRGEAAFSVAPLPVYPVPQASSGTSSVSPIPMARQVQPPRQSSGAGTSGVLVHAPSARLPEESAVKTPTREEPAPVEEPAQDPPGQVEELAADSETQTSQPREVAPVPRRVQSQEPTAPAPGHSASATVNPGRPDTVMSALQSATPPTASKPPARPVSLPPLPALHPQSSTSQAPRQVAATSGLQAPWSWPMRAPAQPQAAEKKTSTPEAPRTLATYLGNPWLLLPPLRGEH